MHGVYTVAGGQIARSMELIWERVKIAVGPNAAVGLAVVLFSVELGGRVKMLGKEGVVNLRLALSGRNINPESVGEYFKGPPIQYSFCFCSLTACKVLGVLTNQFMRHRWGSWVCY